VTEVEQALVFGELERSLPQSQTLVDELRQDPVAAAHERARSLELEVVDESGQSALVVEIRLEGKRPAGDGPVVALAVFDALAYGEDVAGPGIAHQLPLLGGPRHVLAPEPRSLSENGKLCLVQDGDDRLGVATDGNAPVARGA
jgi:hypothetical protein